MSDDLLTTNELAALLGVSRTTIHNWRVDGVLPAPVILGSKAVRWQRAEIQQWLEDSREAA